MGSVKMNVSTTPLSILLGFLEDRTDRLYNYNLFVSFHWQERVVTVTLRPLSPREEDAVSIVPQAGWASGPVWRGMENLIATRNRSPDRTARSDSLCRLRWPER